MPCSSQSGSSSRRATRSLRARTVVVSLLVGIIVTLLASLRPAIKATRVPPIAAVREGAALPAARLSRFGPVASLVTLALGILVLVYGIFGSGLTTASRLLALGFGTLVLFIGVSLNAKRAVRPLASLLGWPGTKLGGTAGTLARENAMRNPSRTAATASALMIGLALITYVAILGAGLRASYGDAVDKLFAGDYALTAENGFDPFAKQADAAVATAAGVTAVSPIRGGDGRAFGDNIQVTGVTPNLAQTVHIDWLPRLRQRPGAARQDRGVRQQGLRKDESSEPRLADRRHDANGQGASPSSEGHLRPAQGRLALRRGDDLRCELRRQLLGAAGLDGADQRQGWRQ